MNKKTSVYSVCRMRTSYNVHTTGYATPKEKLWVFMTATTSAHDVGSFTFESPSDPGLGGDRKSVV